jgi:hypothetical protein
VVFGRRGVQALHRVPEALVVAGVLLLDAALLVRRHHRDAGMECGIDPAVLIRPDAVSERRKTLRQLGPEGEVRADRDGGVDRSERADMLGPNLPGDAPILHQADLKASCLPAESDEHRSGVEAGVFALQRPSCHHASRSFW